MDSHAVRTVAFGCAVGLGLIVALVAAGTFGYILGSATGISERPTPLVVVVTATFTPAPEIVAQVLVDLATSTPESRPTVTPVPTATPWPTLPPWPTNTPVPTATWTPWPTATLMPTSTPAPTATPVVSAQSTDEIITVLEWYHADGERKGRTAGLWALRLTESGQVAGDPYDLGLFLLICVEGMVQPDTVASIGSDYRVIELGALCATSYASEQTTDVVPQQEFSPAPFTCTGGCATPPDPACTIKGNVNQSAGTRIYHTPASQWYDGTDIKPEEGDRWFCTEQEALEAGFRAPQR